MLRLCLSFLVVIALVVAAPCNTSNTVGFYNLRCDAAGNILSPWSTPRAAMDAQVNWYLGYLRGNHTLHGYPTCAYSTFIDGNRRFVEAGASW